MSAVRNVSSMVLCLPLALAGIGCAAQVADEDPADHVAASGKAASAVRTTSGVGDFGNPLVGFIGRGGLGSPLVGGFGAPPAGWRGLQQWWGGGFGGGFGPFGDGFGGYLGVGGL
jgi:hypothetical protein